MNTEKKRVAVTSFAATIDERFKATLEERNIEVVLAPGLGRTTPSEKIIDTVREADAIIAGSEPYTAETLRALPRLKAVVRAGAGTDGIDAEAAKALGVHVGSTPGANAESVADFTVAMMLAAGRSIVQNDAHVKGGGWRNTDQGVDLFGKTVGIIGYGAIGRSVAKRLRGFDCEILAYDPAVAGQHEAPGVALVDLETLLKRSQFVTVHVPLLPETTGLLGEHELEQLPRGAVVVNVARGGIIDEQALRRSIDSGHLHAAAVDVFTSEPVGPDNPLVNHPRILTTAHVAAFSGDGADAMLRQAAEQLLTHL